MPVNTDDLRNAIPSLYPDNLTGQIDAARMREGQRFVADVIDEAIGKTYSDEALASAATATGAAADAVASAIEAALYDGPWLDTVSALIADTSLTYTPAQPSTVSTGDYVRTRSEGFAYQVAASGAVDQHVTTAGGVKLYVLPINGALDLAAFGAVADYTGTPLYDGNDASRITATNNSTAFIAWVKCLDRTGAIGTFKGHYGIKTPNATVDAITLTRDLVIEGVGYQNSRLDFIYEDATGVAYITNATANFMLRINGAGFDVTFRRLSIQATTDGRIIGSASYVNASYYGKVWGVFVTGAGTVTMDRTNAEHFNGSGFVVNNCASWRVLGSRGFYNARSGYWGELLPVFDVIGGEFAYSGFLGNPGTGYGVTGSYGIGTMTVDGVYAHHNYRKGIDTHGALRFTLRNSRFEDNLLYHAAAPITAIPTNFSEGYISVTNNDFDSGVTTEAEAWLRAGYTALYANGFTNFTGAVFDAIVPASPARPIPLFEFSGNRVRGGYRGMDVMDTTQGQALIRFTRPAAGRTIIRDNTIIVPKMGIFKSTFADEYGTAIFGLPSQILGEQYEIADNEIIADYPSKRTITAVDKFGAIFTGHPEAKWVVMNNRVKMQDQYLLRNINASSAIVWGGAYLLSMVGNTITADRKSLAGNSFWFGRVYNLTNTNASIGPNTFIVNGVPHTVGHPSGTRGRKNNRSPDKSYAISDPVVRLVFDKQSATQAVIKVLQWGLTGDLAFAMDYTGSAAVTGTNALVSAAVTQTYSDPVDGVDKTIVTLTALAVLSSQSLMIDVDWLCRVGSFGCERIEFL